MVGGVEDGMNVPNHIALILDGNRRWARKHKLKLFGHKQGGKKFENVLNWCLELGVPHVSAYVLSTENMNRPKKELDELFEVFFDFLKNLEKKKSIFDKYEVKVRFIGDLSKLPPKLVKLMGKIMQKTAKYQKKALNILVGYGGKFELTKVMRKIAEKAIEKGHIEVSEKEINKNLLVPVPIDLIVRTGGVKRLSNFMLWQASYAELIFLDTLWPDFTKEELIWCIEEYNRRQRNFGR
jgi:undecaprenyl diphosphate synthase